MRLDEKHSELKGLGDISQKRVELRMNTTYPLVYRLLCLGLILPVASATVERAFSAIKILKTRLRCRMGDKLLNDCMRVYMEKDIFNSISDEAIMDTFQQMATRRGHL